MGTFQKKIRKKANRFYTALRAIEKQFAQLQPQQNAEASQGVPKTFDLASIVVNEETQRAELKRKARNKRKTAGRKLAKKS